MNEKKPESEEILQHLLAQYSALLAGDQINTEVPRRWVLVSREVGVPSEEDASDRWSLDHLFLDQDGIPTFVELKRSTDTDVRRKVVGQMLDYAANATVYWPVKKLKELFEATCAGKKRDPEKELSKLLGPGGDSVDFWERVETNLKTHKVRMIFVADEIPVELRRIVEFLYEQMDPAEVLALEIRQYAGKGIKTLVPRVFGPTAGAVARKADGPRRLWTEERFLEAVREQTGSEEVEVARKILRWAEEKGIRIWWSKAKKYGSFLPFVEHEGKVVNLFQVYTSGEVYFGFGARNGPPAFDSEKKRRELLARLNSFVDKKLSKEHIGQWMAPIDLSGLKDAAKLKKIKSTFHWFLEEAKAS
jgi:hypothetical protein